MQNDEARRTYPIYYASKLLTDCEQKYSIVEKATTSMLFACTKFRHYLLANQHPILVQSETDELKRVIQQTEPTGRSTRFFAAL